MNTNPTPVPRKQTAFRWFLTGALSIALIVACLAVDSAQAQGPPGGFRGRGGPPGGGPPGGGGPGGGGPADFLRRLDRNGNGMIDQDEMQGPARYMLERFKREMPQLDLSKPVPISQLSEAIERMRSRYSGGGGDSRGQDDSRRSSSGTTTPEIETLVPGFGVPMELPPVMGFGEGSSLFAVQTNEQDLRYSEDRFRRYDRDRDGFLSKEEISSGRWSEDPFKFDRNRDGRLTKEELAVRYAQRRLAENGGGNSDSRDSRGGSQGNNSQSKQTFFIPGSNTSSSSASRSGGSNGNSGGDSRMARMVDFMLSRYDTNKNGVLEKDEWSGMRTDPSPGDKNRDGKLDKGELTRFMEERYGGGGRGGDDGGRRGFGRGGDDGGRGDSSRGGGGDRGRSQFYTGSSSERSGGSTTDGGDSDRRSYRTPTVIERLEEAGLDDDLPDWFFQNDANSDGQVAMAEFAAAWSDRDAAEFVKFDGNNDGFITAAECVAAVKDGQVRGVDSSPRPSSSETASNSDGNSSSKSTSDASGEIPTLYMRYAVGLIKKYDGNSDGMLESSEWEKMSKDVSPADVDSDGKITPAELARFQMPKK